MHPLMFGRLARHERKDQVARGTIERAYQLGDFVQVYGIRQ